MYFTIFVILLSIMGSSIAITDVERLENLKLIHSHIKSYVIDFSGIYKGSDELKTTENYKKFIAQDGIITDAHTKMVNNQEAPSAEKVTADWKTAAGDVIDDCIREAKKYNENQPINNYSKVVVDIKNVTKKIMKAINDDSDIIPQYKKASCPIYEKLKGVNAAFGGSDKYFQDTFAPEPKPMPASSGHGEAWDS